MIKFFRRIRQDLLMENKTGSSAKASAKAGKYLKYAIGEILLVVIGILIALWINNANQDYQQNKEQQELVKSLELELKENLIEFKSHKDYLINCRLYFIEVLNFSAGVDTNISVDSLRSYASKMIPQYAISINTSVLNNYKASGKFNLIDEKLTRLFTTYDTALANYYETIDQFAGFFDNEINEVFLNFSTYRIMKTLHIQTTL